MWKRKSIVAVKETPAESAPAPAPAPASAPSTVRVYKLTQVPKLRQFKITEEPSPNVIYTLTFAPDPQDWAMVLSEGRPEQMTGEDVVVVGAARKISVEEPITELVLGDPSAEADMFQRLELRLEATFPTKIYNLTLMLPPLASDESGTRTRVLELQWKSTNKAKGFMKSMDRGMHHKLIEKSSDTLLARYSHNPWSKDVEGTVEIFADVRGFDPQKWEQFVIVGALAVTEKTVRWLRAKVGLKTDPKYAIAGAAVVGGAVAGGAAAGGATVSGGPTVVQVVEVAEHLEESIEAIVEAAGAIAGLC